MRESDPGERGAGTVRARRHREALDPVAASAGMISRKVSVRPADVVFVKGILEASDGLASLFAERGGDLVLATDASCASSLDALLADLADEIGVTTGAAGS